MAGACRSIAASRRESIVRRRGSVASVRSPSSTRRTACAAVIRHADWSGAAVADVLARRRLRGTAASATPERRYRNAWVFIDRNRLGPGQRRAPVPLRARTTTPRSTPGSSSTATPRTGRASNARASASCSTARRSIVLLMLNCVELISSHVDDPHRQPARHRGGSASGGWRFTFLQHGVTKDDLSRWLNRTADQPLDHRHRGRVPVDRRRRHAVRLHGQGSAPDRVPPPRSVAAARRSPHVLAADRLLLSCRRGAASWSVTRRGRAVPLAHPGFWDSPYATNWLELLRIRTTARARRARRSAHRVRPASEQRRVPARDRSPTTSRSYRYEDVDIQELFARGAAMITDYSSNAFELAYLNRPVIYFQFDRAGLLLRPARLPARRVELRDRRLRARRRARVRGSRRAGDRSSTAG